MSTPIVHLGRCVERAQKPNTSYSITRQVLPQVQIQSLQVHAIQVRIVRIFGPVVLHLGGIREVAHNHINVTIGIPIPKAEEVLMGDLSLPTERSKGARIEAMQLSNTSSSIRLAP